MITDIAHVCIGAGDLAATERFYCNGLGFQKGFDFIRDGKIIGFYLKVAAGRYIEVFAQDAIDSDAQGPIRHLCFETDSIDALTRHMAEQGYALSAKKLGADHSWQAWATDPSGVRMEFHEYTPESSQRTGKDCVLR